MVNKRKILALIILLAGVVVSVSIINSDTPKSKEITASSSNKESNPSFNFDNSKSNDSEKLNLPGEGSEGGEKNVSENSKTTNLTEKLANSYTKQLLSNGEDGSLPSKEKALAELQKTIPQNLNYSTFEEKDIRVSSDNSEEAQVAYMEAIDKAMWDNFGGIKDENTSTAVEKFFKEDNPSVLNKLINITPNYIDDLLQIEVPPKWTTYHLDMLNVWQKKLTIYKAIANYDSDPSKAYLAIQEVPEIIQKSQDVQEVLIKQYNELTKN